jgi:outer membrane protein TolC
MSLLLALQLLLSAYRADAQSENLALTLRDAEKQALSSSNQLKSSAATAEAAEENESAQLQNLLPRLSFQASYQYYATIPEIRFAGAGGTLIPFGTHDVYSFGPQLNYTLWDTFSSRDQYKASGLLKAARDEDRKNTELQLLSSLRNAYVQVQLGIEELTLINGSLELARSEDRDVTNRFKAGAADKIDVITSQRSVLSYQIQFEQRQSQLSSSLQDLLHLVGDQRPHDVSHPGPTGIPGVTFALNLDSLKQLLGSELLPPSAATPGNAQPQIRSQEFQSQSYEYTAKSQFAKVFPVVQLSAAVTDERPNIPNPITFLQETVGVTLSLPLWVGDTSSKLAAEQRRQSDAASYKAAQLQDDISRDYSKARETLASLRVQSELSRRDVEQSEEQARLYFTSYKLGKINFIDVQNANNQALTAKVSSARIDAQILTQVITLLSLSGEESSHGKQ